MIVLAIFALTYVLIAARRLRWLPIGRPAGALLGAVLMVVVGALTPAEAYAAIDHDTVVLLLGMMLMTAYLEAAGFFERLARAMIARAATPWSLLVVVSLAAGGLSAFLVNDTIAVFLTPVVVLLCRGARLPLAPYLMALATSANIGSAATLVGNPQNMLIGSMSGMSFVRFLVVSAPAAIAGLVVNLGLLYAYYGRRLPAALDVGARVHERDVGGAFVRAAIAVAAVVVAFFAGAHLATATLCGVVALMLVERADPAPYFARVNWTVLVFFCGLFVVVAAVARAGHADRAWAVVQGAVDFSTAGGLALWTAFLVVASNVVSNVPLVLLFGPKMASLGLGDAGWVLLAYVTTIAGNFTLLGSVANIIVAEAAKDDHALGFVEHAKFGIVSTVLVLMVGVPLVLWLA